MLAAYGALTLALTYPMVLRLGSTARDWGDPFVNAYIMAWQLDRWATFEFAGYFDTNVFFPHLDTLSYSEFLIPQTLVAAPFYYVSGNPLLAHNVLTLISFVASAFCAYVLVKHITASVASGFVGGLIFAYSPFIFSHLSHLQLIGAAGIPLAFFWLLRYFETRRTLHITLFSITFAMQALAATHYGVYLAYAAGCFILYRAYAGRLFARPRFWAHMATHATLSIVVLAPFYIHYSRVFSSIGIDRRMADVGGWPLVAAPEINRLYGPLTAAWSQTEATLFPGLVASVLTLIGVGWVLKERSAALDAVSRGGWAERAHRILGRVAIAMTIAIVLITTTGGFRAELFGIRLSAIHYKNPMIFLIVCLLGRALLRLLPANRRRTGRGVGRSLAAAPGSPSETRLTSSPTTPHGTEGFFIILLVSGIVLSMGSGGPYRLLFEYAPGFDGIRAVARIHVLTMLAAAVLSGVAVKRLRTGSKAMARPVFVGFVVTLICLEYASVPLPLFTVQPAPEVDRWLARQAGDFALIHYPLEEIREPQRMVRSLRHGKKIVNGLSGFPSPVYAAMRDRRNSFRRSVQDLAVIGVRYMILDHTYYRAHPGRRRQLRNLEPRLVAEIGDHGVYELDPPWLTRAQVHDLADLAAPPWRSLGRDDWTVSASVSAEDAALAVDGEATTSWIVFEQQAGDSITVDLGRQRRIGGVRMGLGRGQPEVPEGLRVEVSQDAVEWRTVWIDDDYELPILPFLRPRSMQVEARFDPLSSRYVRVSIEIPRSRRPWSISELNLLVPDV